MGTLISRLSLYLNALLTVGLLLTVIYALHERNEALNIQVKTAQNLSSNNAQVALAVDKARQITIQNLQNQLKLESQEASRNAAARQTLQDKYDQEHARLTEELTNDKTFLAWFNACLPVSFTSGVLNEPTTDTACPSLNNASPSAKH